MAGARADEPRYHDTDVALSPPSAGSSAWCILVAGIVAPASALPRQDLRQPPKKAAPAAASQGEGRRGEGEERREEEYVNWEDGDVAPRSRSPRSEPQKLRGNGHPRTVDSRARVYEPSDDTFLLVDALTADAAALRAVRPAGARCRQRPVVTHLGAPPRRGVGAAAARARDRRQPRRRPRSSTAATAAAAGVAVHALDADLLRALRPGSVDVVAGFNPPYVPTERPSSAAPRSRTTPRRRRGWRARPRRHRPPAHTRSRSTSARAARLFYLLGVAENEPDEIVAWLGERGFTATTVGERRAQNERLFVTDERGARRRRPRARARRRR